MEAGGVVVGVLEWQLNVFSSVHQFPVGYLRDKVEEEWFQGRTKSQNLTRGF